MRAQRVKRSSGSLLRAEIAVTALRGGAIFPLQVLVELSPTVGQLAQLKSLHLSRNRLQGLPDAVGNLQELQWLDLRRNALAAPPMNALRRMPNLTLLWLDGNPCCGSSAMEQNWDQNALLAAGCTNVACLER